MEQPYTEIDAPSGTEHTREIGMKRILFTMSVLLCLAAFSAAGQEDRVRVFLDKLAENCVSLSYSFKTCSAVPVSGEGTAIIRGDCYYVNGNGMEIWCDGQTRWVVDRSAGEVVIEAVDASSTDWLTNPVAWLKQTGDDAPVRLRFQGAYPCAAMLTLPDGTHADFSFSDWKVNQTAPSFVLELQALPKSYIVTDLR